MIVASFRFAFQPYLLGNVPQTEEELTDYPPLIIYLATPTPPIRTTTQYQCPKRSSLRFGHEMREQVVESVANCLWKMMRRRYGRAPAVAQLSNDIPRYINAR